MKGFSKTKISYILICIALCTLLINVMSLAVPIFTLQVYDRILVYQNMATLSVLTCCAALAIITEILLRIVRKHIVLRLCKKLQLTASQNLIKKLITLDEDKYRYTASEKLSLFRNYANIIDYKYNQRLISYIDVSFIFVHVSVIYIIAPSLALVSIAVISFFVLCLTMLNGYIKNKIKNKVDTENDKFQHLNEIIEKFRFICTNSMSKYFKNRQTYVQRKASMANYKMSFLSMFMGNLSILTPQLNIILMTAIGAYLVLNNTISVGTLIACVIISGRLTFPLNQIVGIWLRKKEYIEAKTSIDQFESIPVENIENSCTPETGNIKLKNVAFEGADLNSKYINLDLKIGDSVAFVGGAKQDLDSLINILIGAKRPLEGCVHVCGEDPSHIDYVHFPFHIGYISQHSKVVTGSIYENLTSFNDAKMEHVYETCKFIGIHDKITQLPQGYNTLIRNVQGEIVSDGLKHLICIARILIHNPKVVIYKHENIYFDDETYNNILDMLGSLKEKTCLILVTSDPIIASIASRQFALENCLIQLATHNKYQFHSQVEQISRILQAHG